MNKVISYGTKKCKWCNEEFVSKRSNQIYCTSDCCRVATNKKILEKYHSSKNKQGNKEKYCKCGNKLSMYNKEENCHACQLKQESEKRIDLLKSLGFSYESDE